MSNQRKPNVALECRPSPAMYSPVMNRLSTSKLRPALAPAPVPVMWATPVKPLKSVIVLGSPVPGKNTWNTSVPGPNGWIPPGIGRGSPARRAASAGPAPSTCPPRNPAAPSPAPAVRNLRRLGPCRWPGSSGRTVTAEERAANIATPNTDDALPYAPYAPSQPPGEQNLPGTIADG